MKSTAVLSSLALGGLAAGQTVQSKPFNLLVQSDSKELDGRALGTCHTGAAIESICLLSDAKAVFNLNTTEGAQPGPGGLSGVLAWTLPSQPPIPSSMSFYTDPSTNVALPLFYPGANNVQYVGFDGDDLMNIVSYLDDTKSPPTGQDPRVLKSWYVCTTYNVGYTYQTLTWVLGGKNPQNPSCVKVDVKRKFVEE
ncbi:hypothetical protein VB005_09081 [Metarhizium brunneum]